VAPFGRSCTCSLVTLSLKCTVFRYSTCKYTVILKPGLGSLNVVENDTIQSGTHDFLLTFHSNHRLSRTVSEINGDFRRKSPIFPTPSVFIVPAEGVPLELGIGPGSEETRMMGLPDGRKCFKIDLAILIQYRRVSGTATHPRCSSIYRAMLRVARVKIHISNRRTIMHNSLECCISITPHNLIPAIFTLAQVKYR